MTERTPRGTWNDPTLDQRLQRVETASASVGERLTRVEEQVKGVVYRVDRLDKDFGELRGHFDRTRDDILRKLREEMEPLIELQKQQSFMSGRYGMVYAIVMFVIGAVISWMASNGLSKTFGAEPPPPLSSGKP